MSDDPPKKSRKRSERKVQDDIDEPEAVDTLVEMAVIPFFVEDDEPAERTQINSPTMPELNAVEEADFDDADDTIRISEPPDDADPEDD